MKRIGVNRKSIKSQQGRTDLKPVVVRMDKFDARMNRLDKKIDSVRQEFKKSRKETKQEIRSVRKDIAKYYFAARDENRIIADEHARTLTKVFTTMDGMAKDYSRWLYEKQFNDAELKRHSRAIDELKEKNAQKETVLQDLQKRVAVVESAKNVKPVSPESSAQLKE